MNPSSDFPVRPFGRALVGAPTGVESADFDRYAIEEYKNAVGALLLVAGHSGMAGAAVLAAWGRPVTALLIGERGEDEDLLHGWGIRTLLDTDFQGQGSLLDGELAQAEVVVDGVLGTGISGPPRERQAFAIDAMNRAEAPVLALDVPSGVDAVTGAVPGDAVVAAMTVAFGGAKLGALLHPARKLVGRLVVVEIGFPPVQEGTFQSTLITPGWVSRRLPRRDPDTHKNAVGALLLVAGHSGMAGAAVLAARAALRAGVGFLRVASPPENRSILQQSVPEAVYVDATDPAALEEAIGFSRALGVGPGLGTGEEGREILTRVLEVAGREPLLLDADALNLVALGRAAPLEEIGRDRDVVLTPHPGEMARLTGMKADEVTVNRPEVALSLARETACTVLLKGMPSLVADPRGRLLVDTVGSYDLAAAGMGDVLSGVISAFLAQGSSSVEAAALGLHTSGRAAARASLGVSLTPEDVVEGMPAALREEGDGFTELDFPFVLFDQDPAR